MKPMLAADCDGDTSKLRFPLTASPKLDGVRAIITPDGVMSRSLKPIPNQYVQEVLRGLPHGVDGELGIGDPTHPEFYRRTVSVVMSDYKAITGLQYFVFDKQVEDIPFFKRFRLLKEIEKANHVVVVPHTIIESEDALAAYEAGCLAQGYEGVMVRDADAPYKHGRSTLREGWLVKVKRFKDSEAVCTGVVEMMHNDNEAFTNELGRTARSTAKAGKRGASVLGALILRHTESGLEFNVGTGFDLATRKRLWEMRDQLPGTWHKYKFFPTGGKDLPRHPVWKGPRDPIDFKEAA